MLKGERAVLKASKSEIARTLIPSLSLLVVGFFALSGCSRTVRSSQASEPPPLKAEYEVGETASIEDRSLNLQFTVNGLREHGGVEFVQPQEGHQWVLVDATIVNQGDKAKSISLADFQLIDSAEKTHETAIFDGALGDVQSLLGKIQPSDKRQGSVLFEIPRSVRGEKLVFQPNRVACEAFAEESNKTQAKKTLVETTFNCQPARFKLN